MEPSQVLTTDGKSDCAVCDDKWQKKKPSKYESGAVEIPTIITMSLLTRLRQYVSINVCSMHLRHIGAFTSMNDKSISVKNVNTMKTRIFRRIKK